MKRFIVIITTSLCFASCPDGFFEDDCGNCWLPYCYNFITNEVAYDTNQENCLNQDSSIWVNPGDEGDPYFNNYCDGNCPAGYIPDNCNHCWSSFCYTFFSEGLNGDPAHSVYYDLSIDECESYGYNYYSPNHRFNPQWNYGCIKENKNSKQAILMKTLISTTIRVLAIAAVYFLVN